ncbi:hypothetical protein LXA43DRAFT_903869 [Ganoderma leucocontextum]|nr:hypothetical protein LXA43DRAFT_903869 [Ganoderma leucocontextum]
MWGRCVRLSCAYYLKSIHYHGSSTRNTRIERLWVEVGRSFCREWRAFFTRLERCHQLDRSNPHHLWLIHALFLVSINDDCQTFQNTWNAHPISGPDTHDQSPDDMRFLAQTTEGIYEDDGADIHPDILHESYGTTSESVNRRRVHQTGAGHPPEEEESENEQQDLTSLEDRIADAQQSQIRHEAIDVPNGASPFADDHDLEEKFFAAFNILSQSPGLPSGYGLLPEEMEDGYEVMETIRSGRRGRKELVIDLPEVIWRPRAELWGKALHLLNTLLYSLDNDP